MFQTHIFHLLSFVPFFPYTFLFIQYTLQFSHCIFHRNALIPIVLLLKSTYPSRPHSSLTAIVLLPQCNLFFHIFVPQPFALVPECFNVLFLCRGYLCLCLFPLVEWVLFEGGECHLCESLSGIQDSALTIGDSQ